MYAPSGSVFNFSKKECGLIEVLFETPTGSWQTSPALQMLHLVSPHRVLSSRAQACTSAEKVSYPLIYDKSIVASIFHVNYREGSGGLWNAEAKHRDPQVCVPSLQAEAQGNGEASFLERPLQHPEVRWRERARPSSRCRLLQRPEGNGREEALKHIATAMHQWWTSSGHSCKGIR